MCLVHAFSHNHVDQPAELGSMSSGFGGGLSYYVVRGNALENNFMIQNRVFFNSTAVFGGGLLIELHDMTSRNLISIAKFNLQE